MAMYEVKKEDTYRQLSEKLQNTEKFKEERMI